MVFMGILERFGLSRSRFDALSHPTDVGLASPWQGDGLSSVTIDLIDELYGADARDSAPLGRAAAMSVPAVAKARNLLVSSIAAFPLEARRSAGGADEDVTEANPWLYRTNGAVSPYERMVCTVDDGFFYGMSLWLTDRSGPERDGDILQAEYCPWNDWSITDKGVILVGDRPAQTNEVIFFNFSTAGILVEGRKTLRGARDTEAAWTGRMRNPIPLIELNVTDDNFTQDEVDSYVTAWAKARRQENGAVSFTPPGMTIETHGEVHADLYIENRNAVRTDVGSFANVRASMLDGTAGIDSLTYSTTQGERNSFYEFDLPFWTGPIEARLSQDDVVPRGTRVRFNKNETYLPTPTPTGAPEKD